MFTVSKVLRGLVRRPLYRREMVILVRSPLSLPKMNTNTFHTNTKLCVKMYAELENGYAYRVMETNGYAISLNVSTEDTKMTTDQFEQLMTEDWSKLQPKQNFEIFSVLGAYCSANGLCISNKIFDDLIDNLTDNIIHASDEELKSIFFSLNKWPETESIRTRNYIEVWAALDDTCLKRMKDWNHDKMLQYVALFFMLNVTRHSDFSLRVVNKLATKAKHITPSQMVQAYFYTGVLRKQPFDMHNLEIRMIEVFQQLTLDDIGIISMGFFKSKTPIRSMELVSKIINKIIEETEDIHDVSLAAILKVIRYSVKVKTDDKIYRLLDTLQYRIDRMSIMCIVHLALLGTSSLTFHKDCLIRIAEKLNQSLPSARIKDLERIVLTFSTFNFVPPLKSKECTLENIINELRKSEREAEIIKHGKSFACCINYLGTLQKYPVDLMNKALSSEFLENTYGTRYTYGREILGIHNTSIIFCQGATMNRLDDKTVMMLAKKYTDYIPNENFKERFNVTEKMFLDVYKALCDIRGGEDFVKGDHVLPHHQRGDIIICNNCDGMPIPVTEKLKSKFGLIKRPPDNNHWIVLVIAGRNTIIHGTDKPTGPFMAKLMELKSLGYHGILVPWSVYTTKKTRMELCNYLNSIIN